MAASDVEVCSNALVLIGDAPISSFDSNQGQRADVANNLFTNIRDATLRMHPWNSCRKRLSLPPDATAPIGNEWSASFALPADYIRLVQVGSDPNNPPDYEIENGAILMDGTECFIKYIYRNANVATYDALLTQALIAHLAWAFSYPLAKSQALRDGMQAYLNQVLQMARTVNGQEKQSEQLGLEQLYSARFMSGR